MSSQGNIGTGIVSIKVDFVRLEKELARVDKKIQQHRFAPIQIRLDYKKFKQDLARFGTLIYRFRNQAERSIPMSLNTQRAQQQIRDLRQQLADLRRGPTTPIGGGGGGGRTGVGAIAGGTFIGNIGARAMTGAARAGEAAVGAAKEFAVTGVFDNAEVEIYTRSLKVLLKDQEKANKLFRELQKLDLELPVDIGTLAQNAQKLAGAGFDPEKIEDMLRNIMDAASIGPQGMQDGTSRMVRALTQMRAKGNIQLEDLNQVSELGVPIRQIIREQFGMSASDLGERTRDGSIGIDQAIDGMLKGFENRFGGALEERTKTLTGSMEQIGARFKALRREMMQPFFEEFKAQIANLSEWMKSQSFQELTRSLEHASRAFVEAAKRMGLVAPGAEEGATKEKGVLGKAAAGYAYLEDASVFTMRMARKAEGRDENDVAGDKAMTMGTSMALLYKGELLDNLIESAMKGQTGHMTNNQLGVLESYLSSQGDFKGAYELAERRGDKKAMQRYRDTDSRLDERLAKEEAPGKAKAAADKAAKDFIESTFGTKGKPKAMPSAGQALIAAQDWMGDNFGGSGGGIGKMFNPGAWSSMFKNSASEQLGKQWAADADAKKRTAADEAAVRDDALVKGPKFREALKEAIKDNPGLAGTEFTQEMFRDKDGNLKTRFGVGDISKGPGMTQLTDFTGLNKMLQGQLDSANMEKHAKDTAEAAKKLVDEMNKSNDTLGEIKEKLITESRTIVENG